jgi:hypothetical protein
MVSENRATWARSANGWSRLTVTRGCSSPGRRSSSTVASPHPPARAASSRSAQVASSKQVALNCPDWSLSVAIMNLRPLAEVRHRASSTNTAIAAPMRVPSSGMVSSPSAA